MADLRDVEDALVAQVSTALALSGAGFSSALNANVRVFPGWPAPNSVDTDMVAGAVVVSVFAAPGVERNTTRFPVEWKDQTLGVPTIAASVAGPNVTFSGTVTAGNYVSVLYLGRAWSYLVQGSDTLASVAAALAALISPTFDAVSSGPILTIAGQGGMTVRIGAPGTVIRELERVNQRFMISVHAPNDGLRQAAARLIRPALAAINFLGLPDTSAARVVFDHSAEIDEGEKVNIYRRSLFYWVEYPTTSIMPGYPVTIAQTQITANGSPAVTGNS